MQSIIQSVQLINPILADCLPCLAGLVVAGAVTSSEGAVGVAAKRLLNIQSLPSVSDGGPVPAAVGAVDGDADVVATIGLEVRVTSEPPPHLMIIMVTSGQGELDGGRNCFCS